MSFEAAAVARALDAAKRERRKVGPLDPAIAPRTLAEGAAAQRALAGLWGAVPPGGFKVGATGPKMRAYLGLDAPVAGFMRAEDIWPSGTRRRHGDYLVPSVECEIAVRLAADLPARPTDAAEAAAAVGAVMAAIELVENRYGDLRELGTPTLLADRMFHAAAVTGVPMTAWRGLDLVAIEGRISVNGEVRGEGRGGDLLGHPMNALAWLAGSPEAAAFGGLRAGQVVLLGSVVAPFFLETAGRVVVSFPPLPEVVLDLD